MPFIFEPPAELGQFPGVDELWFVVSDTGPNYGGCNILISFDGGVTYETVGTIHGNATTGLLTVAWPPNADPDNTNDLTVDLTESVGSLVSYTNAERDAFIWPCIVTGGSGGTYPYELMSYKTATLISGNIWKLAAAGTLRRAVYGVPTPGAGVNHPIGSHFALLDPFGTGIFKFPLPAALIGMSLSFKFQQFNSYGAGFADVSGLTVYTYTPQGYGYSLRSELNSLDYSVSPGQCLSQTASTFNIVLAAVTVNFPTHSVVYAGRTVATVADPGAGNVQTYYVTIQDPNYLGDPSGVLTSFADTTTVRVGVKGYTYLGRIEVSHTGGTGTVSYAGGGVPSRMPQVQQFTQ